MTTDKNKQNQTQTDPLKDPLVWMIMALVGAAVLDKKAFAMKVWLYDHMILLTFIGIGLLVLLGFYIRYRIQKKDKEFLERARNLKAMRPQNRQMDYYRKRGN